MIVSTVKASLSINLSRNKQCLQVELISFASSYSYPTDE